jgi:hypothetical protein
MALVVLSGVLAQAAGRQEAYEICTSMTFDSDRNACVSAIGKHEYFDQGAINVCVGMTFDSGKSECVSNIADKTYDPYETTNCAKNSFDSGKNECLKSSGRPAHGRSGCLSKQDVIFELQLLDRMVSHGDNLRARDAIYSLINNLQACP